MDALHLTLLTVHILAGTAAVGVGLAALLSMKAGRLHRRAGRLFARSMVGVIGTAVVLTTLAFDPYFAGLTASALIATFSGVRVLRRKRPDLRPEDRATPLDWAVVGVVVAVAVGLLALAATGAVTRNLPVVYAMAGGCLLYGGYDAYRFARPLAFPFSKHLWLYEHLVKMLGAYFGAVAAFSGSVLVFLDPPWRQLWAVSLGQTLAVVLVLYYWRTLRENRRHRLAPLSGPGVGPSVETA